MKLLAIETSTEACSVALGVGSEVTERLALENRSHGERVLPWVAELMAGAELGYQDLDGIVVSQGPGGFTSLRIGLAIVQGMALGAGLPVYPVSSLATLAREGFLARGPGHFLAILDARMGEVYTGGYQVGEGELQLVGEESLVRPAQVAVPGPGSWAGCGSGFPAYPGILENALGSALDGVVEDCWPRARSLLSLASTVNPRSPSVLEPVYLRDRVAG